jgi:quercetin dioxygenase-like cupin family protein
MEGHAGPTGLPIAMIEHPIVIRPEDHAQFQPAKMGKSTLFESPRLLVGLNAFEPGQSHALHAHHGMDKVYHVVSGEGRFLLEGRELPMRAGDLLVAPDGVPHGVHNTGADRLIVLAILAPGPGHA